MYEPPIPPIPPQPQQQQQQQQQQELIDRLERRLLDVKRQTQEREEIWKSLVRDKDAALASLAAKHEAAVNMLHDELKEKVMKRLKTEWEKEKKGMGTSDLDERSFFAPFAWAAGGCVIVTVPSTRKMACSFQIRGFVRLNTHQHFSAGFHSFNNLTVGTLKRAAIPVQSFWKGPAKRALQSKSQQPR